MKKIDFSKLSTWGYGLLAACISAAATTGSAVLGSFALGTKLNWPQLWISIGISALGAAFAYLKSSPLPETSITIKETTTKTVDVSGMPKL